MQIATGEALRRNVFWNSLNTASFPLPLSVMPLLGTSSAPCVAGWNQSLRCHSSLPQVLSPSFSLSTAMLHILKLLCFCLSFPFLDGLPAFSTWEDSSLGPRWSVISSERLPPIPTSGSMFSFSGPLDTLSYTSGNNLSPHEIKKLLLPVFVSGCLQAWYMWVALHCKWLQNYWKNVTVILGSVITLFVAQEPETKNAVVGKTKKKIGISPLLWYPFRMVMGSRKREEAGNSDNI